MKLPAYRVAVEGVPTHYTDSSDLRPGQMAIVMGNNDGRNWCPTGTVVIALPRDGGWSLFSFASPTTTFAGTNYAPLVRVLKPGEIVSITVKE